jgi:hypothetical protein
MRKVLELSQENYDKSTHYLAMKVASRGVTGRITRFTGQSLPIFRVS